MEYQLISPINKDYSVVEQILVNRGIRYADIPHYLNLSDRDVYSPDGIDNIHQGVQMILNHLRNGKIYVIVDSDADGYLSAAILLNYLHNIVPSIVENNFTYNFHPGKQHGIDLNLVPSDVTLVIAPDSSSNDFEIHEELSKQGIDVLVIDHHQAEKVSEYACVINNQLCNYPTKSLSGAGMVYKVCQYMDKLFNVNYANNYLDLTSLALCADMMDVRDFETAYLIQSGLKNIRNPFMNEMVEKNRYQLGTSLTPIGIAFYVAPYINAITRVGQEEEKRTLFEAMLEWKAYESIPSTKRGCKGQFEQRVVQAVRNCTNVKSRQTRTRDQSLEAIENLIEERNLLSKKILIIKLDKFSVDKGLTGLIANELMSKYKRPVFMLNKCEHEDGTITWEGSARGYEKSKLNDLRGFVRDSGYAIYAEGHPNAHGIGFTPENLDEFITYSEIALKDMDFTPSYKVDFIYSAQNLNPNDILAIGGMKPLWGQSVEEALVVIENIKVTANNIQLMSRDKSPTLKITLPNGVACIKFKSSEEEFQQLFSESGCVVINIVGKCELNDFRGLVTPQIIIENYDIISNQKYYF